MTALNVLSEQLKSRCAQWIDELALVDYPCPIIKEPQEDSAPRPKYGSNAFDSTTELTLITQPQHILPLCQVLRDDPDFNFKMLVDICGVDYLHYGLDEWQTQSTTQTGFSRGQTTSMHVESAPKPNRFAVVYHLLSLNQNHRLRLRVNFHSEHELILESVIAIWPAANWFERETFDLFGILFKNHPDLRRLLTDYGFSGHPFRKDFPLIGKVEARYDAQLKRVIYEPVSIESRVLEPKVIRHDHRYASTLEEIKRGGDGQV